MHVNKVREGDITYEAVDANVRGGQLVVASATATTSGEQGATPAGADSALILGIAEKDAVTEANVAALTSGTGPSPLTSFVTDASVPTSTFTVYNDCITEGLYLPGTACNYGDRLKSAANGQVTKWVKGTDAVDLQIGWCAQKGGVGTAGGRAKLRINV